MDAGLHNLHASAGAMNATSASTRILPETEAPHRLPTPATVPFTSKLRDASSLDQEASKLHGAVTLFTE